MIRFGRLAIAAALVTLLSTGVALAVAAATGSPPQAQHAVWRLLLVVAALGVTELVRASRAGPLLCAGAAVAGAGTLTLWTGAPPAVTWAGLALGYAALAWLGRRHAGLGLLAAVTLAWVVTAVDALRTAFSEEEFYTLLQWLSLALLGGLVVLAARWLAAPRAPRGIPRDAALAIGLGLLAVCIAVLALVLPAYRGAFSPQDPPGYPGVTEQQPYLCGAVPRESEAPRGNEVLARALSLVARGEPTAPPELALLALAGDASYAARFRDALLAEASAGAFTGPAGTVKSAQYEAARRVYFTDLVLEAYPALFTAAEQRTIDAWFNAINRRALTVEGVDVLYALAFGRAPQGPYENQEIGAGLLALLAQRPGADPALVTADRTYLAGAGGGWRVRARNNDDVLYYQALWLDNAYYQSLNMPGDEDAPARRDLAFEWLLLQASPDGESLAYNFGFRPSFVGTYLLGARLTGDARYVWLAQRAVQALAESGRALPASPGLVGALQLEGVAPDNGSCLIFGDTGLPGAPGPLGPDKLVLREGWAPDSTLAITNLRFTGWHRYKATGSLSYLGQDGALVVEEGRGAALAWVPAGRSLFRDKRIPRENLNAVLIPRTGLGAVLQALSGVGSPWAQDPPHYATVNRFETLGAIDTAELSYVWDGWMMTRTLYLLRDGPVLILDRAANPKASGPAAVAWHLVGEGRRTGDVLELSGGAQLLLPHESWNNVTLSPSPRQETDAGLQTPDWSLTYTSPSSDRLDLASVFLLHGWSDAQSRLLRSGDALTVESPAGTLRLLQPASGRGAASFGAVDGQAVLLINGAAARETTVCFVRADELRLPWATEPVIEDTIAGQHHWDGAELVLSGLNGTSQCFRIQ